MRSRKRPNYANASNVNDFVKVKTHAEKKLLSAEYKLALFDHFIHLNFALKVYMNLFFPFFIYEKRYI